jgi:serine/threonine-protein kinase
VKASVLAQGEVVARRYRLVERIGEGGMGEVWRAEQESGGRPVALKFIRAEIAAHSDQAYERFEREARSARAVRHTNVIDVLDYGMSEDGTPYLAMEYLEGQSLERLFEQKPPPTIGEVVAHLAAALGGLAAIHERGIVHRDLKPSNIFLARNGSGDAVTPKLLDFGIARETGFDGQTPKTLTRTGEALGTPHYMSPEQIRAAKTVDHRSDIYSMGVILYEALAGRRPFDGPSPAAVIAAIVTRDSPPLQSLCADAPPALVAVVDRALAYDADERFQSALEMKRALVSGGGGSGGRVAPREARSRESLESADTVASGRPAPPASAVSTARPAPRTRRAFLSTLFAVGSVGTAGLAALILYVGTFGDGGPESTGRQPGDRGGSQEDDRPRDLDRPVHPLPGRGGPELAPAPLAELALAWRDLPADVRDAGGWRFEPTGDGRYRASRAGSGGLERGPAGLRPAFLRTTSRLNIRSGPSADDGLVRTLPVGTLVVGLYGDFDGLPSAAGSTGNWTRTVVTPDDEGWCASRYLEPTSGCIPPAAPALSAIPEERHDVVRRTLLFSRARVRRGGAPSDAVLTVGRDEAQSTSYVALHLRQDGCNISSLTSIAVPGFVEEAFVVDTAPDGGETLLVIGWHPDRTPERGGAERWSVYTLGQGEMVWEGSFPTSESLPRRQRAAVIGPETDGPDGREGYYPLVVRRADNTRVHYVWDGRTLVAAPAAAPPGRAH